MNTKNSTGRYFLDTDRLNTYKRLLNTHIDSLNRKNDVLEKSGYKLLTSITDVAEFNNHPELFICHQVAEKCGLNTSQIDVLKVFAVAKKPANYNDLVSKVANHDMIENAEYSKAKWVIKANAIKEEDFWVYYRNEEQRKAIEALGKALEQIAIVSKYVNGRASYSILDQIGALSQIDGDKFLIRKDMAVNL